MFRRVARFICARVVISLKDFFEPITTLIKWCSKKRNTRVGVSVVLVNKKNEVLVGIRKGAHGAGLLAVPGGHIEFSEAFETTCNRELMEEIGISFPGQYKSIGFSEDFFPEEKKHYVTLYFGVKVDSDKFVVQNLEPEKCEEWKWIPVRDLPKEGMFCKTYDIIQAWRS